MKDIAYVVNTEMIITQPWIFPQLCGVFCFDFMACNFTALVHSALISIACRQADNCFQHKPLKIYCKLPAQLQKCSVFQIFFLVGEEQNRVGSY